MYKKRASDFSKTLSPFLYMKAIFITTNIAKMEFYSDTSKSFLIFSTNR